MKNTHPQSVLAVYGRNVLCEHYEAKDGKIVVRPIKDMGASSKCSRGVEMIGAGVREKFNRQGWAKMAVGPFESLVRVGAGRYA